MLTSINSLEKLRGNLKIRVDARRLANPIEHEGFANEESVLNNYVIRKRNHKYCQEALLTIFVTAD